MGAAALNDDEQRKVLSILKKFVGHRWRQALRQGAARLLRLEWLWIAVMIFAYWHISPPIRDRYVFLLGFAAPIYGLRWLAGRRLLSGAPLDLFLLLFIPISIYNFYAAPLPREDYLVVACRYFLGIFIIFYFVEHARRHRHIRYLTLATVALGILISLVTLVASQWDLQDKSELIRFATDSLPRLDSKRILPDMLLSFNPNEIAGAVSYFCPFTLAVCIGSFRTADTSKSNRRLRWISLFGFALSLTALLLGQSRFALAGAGIALLMVIVLLLPGWRIKRMVMALWSLFVLFGIFLVFDTAPVESSQSTAAVLSQRNQHSLSIRFEIWDRALRMIRDYPMTGSGISTYRGLVQNERYAVRHYAINNRILPHAHNAFLQMGADLGVMGLLLFVVWYGITGAMAIQNWRRSSEHLKVLTVAAAAGILAHLIYGIGDAIPFWDRFAFVHWWFIGLIAALHVLKQPDDKGRVRAD